MIPAVQNSSNLHLLDMIQRLEARVAQLESILVRRGSTVRLQSGESYIELGPDSMWIESKIISLFTETSIRLTGHDLSLNSSAKTTITAGGDLVLKGARIQEN
jgi:hypothetical protein